MCAYFGPIRTREEDVSRVAGRAEAAVRRETTRDEGKEANDDDRALETDF